MNWDFIEGNWDQIKSKIKKHWGRLTDDELEVMDGKRDDFPWKTTGAIWYY